MSDINPHVCKHLALFEPGSTIVTVMACAIILTIRIYAIYHKSKRILVILCMGMLCELAILSLATSQFKPLSLPSQIKGCVATGQNGNSGFVIAFWAAPLFFDSLVMILTVWRVVTLRRDSGGQVPILNTFLQDGAFYYGVILVADTINIAFYAQPDTTIQTINAPLSTVLTSLMASRLVLSLHGTVSPPSSGEHFQRVPGAGHPSLPLVPLSPLKQPRRVAQSVTSRRETTSHPLHSFRGTPSPPLAHFTLQSANQMPHAVRVALRGIGNDEVELGLKTVDEEQREREHVKEKEKERRKGFGSGGSGGIEGLRSESVGSGIKVEREFYVEVDEGFGAFQDARGADKDVRFANAGALEETIVVKSNRVSVARTTK
ncbi:hypothetical protein T439DRAFT_355387 [Meredithblackwellia eburnea MCA 4105]